MAQEKQSDVTGEIQERMVQKNHQDVALDIVQEQGISLENREGMARQSCQDATRQHPQETDRQENGGNTQEELLAQAMATLHNALLSLCGKAGKTQEYGEEIWGRLSKSNGVLREFAYYHDYGNFYGQYKVAGYSLTDILVWQVDHFKAYMDRHEEMNRYRTERLLLESLDIMLQMEKNPAPFVAKMQGETGTDFADKY